MVKAGECRMKPTTMLELMEEERIFYISKESDGMFRITENCDDYFSVKLTKESLEQLGKEMIELASRT